MKSKLSERHKVIYAELTQDAEKFLCTRTKFTGEIRHIPDGKADLMVSFKWPELLKVMSQFFVSELNRLPELSKK